MQIYLQNKFKNLAHEGWLLWNQIHFFRGGGGMTIFLFIKKKYGSKGCNYRRNISLYLQMLISVIGIDMSNFWIHVFGTEENPRTVSYQDSIQSYYFIKLSYLKLFEFPYFCLFSEWGIVVHHILLWNIHNGCLLILRYRL